jgi:hypothetical protein
MIILAVVTLGALLHGAALEHYPIGDGIGPLLVSRDRDGPLLVVREQSAPPLVAIRLSVPISEPPGLAGAGRVLQLLVADRARGEVERFGGELELSRTPGHLVYAIRGPATAFGEMVAVLKYAVAPPLGITRAPSALWLTARQEALVDFETPERLLRQRLERLLFPVHASVLSAPDLEHLPGTAELEWFCRRWFRPSSMSVVIVGPVTLAEARAAFRGWPEPPRVRAHPPGGGSPSGPPPRAEVMAPRAGLGYAGGAAEPAALAIAAELIKEELPALGLRRASAELWWIGGRTALVVMGAAPPVGNGEGASLPTTLQLGVASAVARATGADLDRVRRRLQHAILMRARTPAGMAGAIGEFLDRTGEPKGVEEFLSALAEMDEETVRSTMRTLLYRSPQVVELVP